MHATIAIPARIAPIDLGPDCLVYRENDLARDLEPHLDFIEFFVPPYIDAQGALALMGDMPALRVCQLLTAGFENAVPYLPDGVTLCNAAGVHDASTAELALGLIIASLRGIDIAARDMQTGTWRHATLPALADKHVVVIGSGAIGTAIRHRLEPFETTITMVGRTSRTGVVALAEAGDALRLADVVVLIVPLDDSTDRLVDAAFLARLKDGCLVVNVARGQVVDTDALMSEVSSGRLRAAIDVTDPEPLPPDHPLWTMPGVLITPHLGGDTSAFEPRARTLVARQVSAWRQGLPLGNVAWPS